MSNKNNNKKSSCNSLSGVKQSNANSRTVNAPAAIGVSKKASMPKTNGNDRFVVNRREFVGTATNGSTTGFALTPVSMAQPGYDFNPAVPIMFPWLSQIAGAFERFRFNKLDFEFIPGQSTATAGRFYAAIDYDYDDAVASSKSTLMGNMSAVESAVWQPCSLRADPASLNRDMPYRYVSCTTRGLQVEQRTSNSGYLMVAFDTAVADCLVDIWVNYQVELVTPVNDYAIVQSLGVSTASDTSLANVAPAHGTAYASAVPKSTLTNAGGPLVPVIAGANGVPSLSGYLFGAAISAATGLEIRSVKTRGLVGLLASFLETGVPPNNVLGAVQADVNWQVLDYNGAYLGAAHSASGAKRTLGPASGAGGTLGAEIVSVQTVPIETLMSSFPTAKYLICLIMAQSAIGAGKAGWGFTYSD